MNERRDVRVSDKDRAAAVERLRVAHDEGRLSLLEYDERLARAYQSVTYGDLAELFVDLPDAAHPAPAAPARPAAQPPGWRAGGPAGAGGAAALPTWLRIVWAVWATAVGINVVIWALVSASNADLHYFWPMWVAGPPAALLLGLSAGAVAIGRNRRHTVRVPRTRPPRERLPRSRRPSR